VRVVECNELPDGIYTTKRALDTAKELGLDLIVVAPNANPVVCKIVDYGKFKYEISKTQKSSEHKQKELKTLQISPATALHDLEVQARKATDFLKDGHKVKLTCRFRARQLAHPEVGRTKMDQLIALIGEVGKLDGGIALDGRVMIATVSPTKKA